MNPAVLLCHPRSFSTESYLSYILRLSETNGYSSPRRLYSLAGVHAKRQDSGFSAVTLARMTHGDAASLQQISYTDSRANLRSFSLLGHEIKGKRLSLSEVRLCPQCVAEKGFIEAHWDLKLMIGCPDHHCRAADVCPRCFRPIRRFRPGLLECECGGDLSESELAPISSDDASLLGLIRDKILGISPSGEELKILPYQDLLAMNLQLMINVIEVVGRHRLAADRRTHGDDSYEVVHAAARVLKDWPTNFHALLKDLESGSSNDDSDGAQSNLRILCDILFTKRPQHCPQKQAASFRQAFIGFAIMQWGNGLAPKALLRHLMMLGPDSWMTVKEWANRAGVSPTTAAKFLRDTGRQTLGQSSDGRGVCVIVAANDTIPAVAPGKILKLDEAATCLGMPACVLAALKKSDLYEGLYRGPVEWGFHELDLKLLGEKLLKMALGHRVSCSRNQCVSLRTILAAHIEGFSRRNKEKILYCVLNGEMRAVETVDGTVGGLLIVADDYEKFLSNYAARFHRDYFNHEQVGRLLKCAKPNVGNLVDRGLLCGTQGIHCAGVDKDSVRRFCLKYVSLKSIARDMRVTTVTILRYCDHKQVALLLPKKGNPRAQSFISVADNEILRTTGISNILNELARITPSYAHGYGANQAIRAIPFNIRKALERQVP